MLTPALLPPHGSALKPSVRWNTIRGLFLMHLLVQNRLAEFHSEVRWRVYVCDRGGG